MTSLEQEFLNNAGIFITVCLFLCGVLSLLQIIYPLLDENYKEKIEDKDWSTQTTSHSSLVHSYSV